jgi:superkiller protein 3
MASMNTPGNKTPLECIHQGDQCFKQKDYTGALGYYNMALDLIAANHGTKPGQKNRGALRLDLKIRACFGKGDALRMLQDFDQAMIAYEAAIEAYKNSGSDLEAGAVKQDVYNSYLGMSLALRGQKNFQQAFHSCDQAIQLAPGLPAAYHEKALVHYNLRDYQESLQACERAIHSDPQYISAYISKGDACLALHDFQQARQTYERAIQMNPTANTYAYSGLGQALYHLREFADAQLACDRALQISAENFLASLCKGDIFRTLGKYEDACAHYTLALQQNNMYVLAYIGRGECLLATDKKTEALADHAQAIQLDAETIEAGSARAYLGQGAALAALGRHLEACRAYQKALQKIAQWHYSRDEQLAGKLGEAQALYKLQDYQVLLQICEQLLVLEPQQADAFYYQGEAYRHLNQHEKAVRAYSQALECDDRLIIYEGIEQSLSRLKYYKKLTSTYEKVYQELNRRQKSASYLSASGEFYCALGRYQEAREVYEEALKLAPNEKALFMAKGKALFHLALYAQAGAAYNEALRLDSNLIAAYIGKGDAFRLQKNYQDATGAYFQAIEKARTLGRLVEAAPAFYGRGLVKREQKKIAMALGDFQEAVKQKADNAAYHFQQGFALTALARYPEALEACERAIVLGSSDARELASFHTQKGHVYRRTKRYGEARTAYEQALQIVPDFEDANRGMRLLP